MSRTVRIILLAALVLAPGASAGPAEDYQAVRADYQSDSDVTACRFTRQQLQNAKDSTPPDVRMYEPNFTAEIDAEIRRHDTGGCQSGGGTGGGGGGTGGDDEQATKVATTLVRPGVSARQVGGRIKVRVTGRIVKGAGPCNGRVAVVVRAAGRRRARKLVRINSSCKYATTLSFRVKSLPSRLRPRARRLSVLVNTRYNGTGKRRADRAPSRLKRVRR